MISPKVAEVFEAHETGKAPIGHRYTASGPPVGAAAALACLAETKRLNVPENAAARGQQVYEGCLHLQEKYELIGDVRGGHGLMTAMELVSDRETKAPVGKSVPLALQETTYQNGAMVRVSGPNVILSPALIISEAEINTVLTALDKGLAAASQA